MFFGGLSDERAGGKLTVAAVVILRDDVTGKAEDAVASPRTPEFLWYGGIYRQGEPERVPSWGPAARGVICR